MSRNISLNGTGRILVTGASGFVGSALAKHLADRGQPVLAAVRKANSSVPSNVELGFVGNLTPDNDWSNALIGVDTVVHCAARAHILRETTSNPLTAFQLVNVAATVNLARQAAAAGVRRFVFISSIGVNGTQTTDKPYTVDDMPAPTSAYGQSKLEAEIALREIQRATSLEVVIIRPPLVHGPGAPGNFRRLMLAIYKGIPLPLGAIHNRRSLVALDNLVDLLTTCVHHPAAGNQTFLVSDNEDLSTTQLILRLAHALGRRARLFPIPAWLLQRGAALLGKRELSQRLCSSLQVDISKTRRILGWNPPVSVDEALSKTARHFLSLNPSGRRLVG